MRKHSIPVSIAVTALFLLATIIVSVYAFGAPRETSKVSPLLSYNLQGTFSEQAYGYRSTDTVCVTCGQTDLVYFPAIIDTVTGEYTYEFLSKETVADVKTQLQISAILTRGTMWSKEVSIVPSQEMLGTSVTFPLDMNSYLELANAISEELGLGKVSSIDVVLTARVHTEAMVGGTFVTDNLVQTCKVTLSSATLQWTKPLDLAQKGYQSGKAYEQRGSFGYSIVLLPNILYGATTLTEPSPPAEVLRKLDQATSYKADEIDNMDIDFAYNLIADKSVGGVTHEVEASAVLSNADGEQVVFPLLAKQQFTAYFTARLPLDVTLLYAVINQMENTTDNDFKGTYDLAVKVSVHTTATEPGVIDEGISAVLPVKITADSVTIESPAGNTKTGSLTKTEMVPNQTRSMLMMVSLSLLCLTLVAGLWLGWNFWERRHKPSPVYELWEATRQTMERHKGIFVNVAQLPAIMEAEKTIRLESLSELVKLADSLLKPILHVNDAERHTFCVIDGTVRYEHFVIEPPSQ